MDNSLKGLLLAAGVIITCIVVSLGFYISREANAAATSGVGQISRMNKEISESDKSMYDGLVVTGAEVINAIKKNRKEDVAVVVETKKAGRVSYNRVLSGDDSSIGGESSASVVEAQNITNNNYINQNAQFVGTVIRDVNDTIIAIKFVQE
ncbi:MAG TPA: hypothetical protein GXZ90_08715 [Clostridiales bacterium]|nr:hypothetical protein [Clostridiales bacterium]